MKFYVHHEPGIPELGAVTFVFKLQANDECTTVADIEQICTKELTAKLTNGKHFDCHITKGKGRKRLSGSDSVIDLISDGEDIFLIERHRADIKPSADQKYPVNLGGKSQPTKQETRTKTEVSGQITNSTQEKADILKYGQKLEDDGNCHQAAALYDQWLQKAGTGSTADLYNRLVNIYLRAERYDKALLYAETGLKSNPKCQTLKLNYAECLVNSSPKKALEVIVNYTKELRSIGTASTTLKHKLQMLMCSSYYNLGKPDMAIVLVEGVLREDKNDQAALLEFANLTFDLGEEQAMQSMTILLSALVKNKDSSKTQKYLATACRKPKGMEYLKKVSGDAWNSIPAIILLANVFRDQGAVDLSQELLKRALELKSSNPNAVLGYIHLQEILNKPDEAIDQIRSFCQSCSKSPVFMATASHISAILDQIKSPVYLHNKREAVSIMIPQVAALSESYTTDDLTVLAVWFTLVKILYVQGCLLVLPTLCALLEPFFKSRELHMTEIRNEAAYFSCLNKLVQGWHKVPEPKEDDRFVYMIGDSHCITPAWKTVAYGDGMATIHPVLSTGTKIWHLRPESVFYPKTNFYNVISVIPDGACVIINLGEIDCREALCQCVLKCQYDTLEAAVDHVLDIYCCLLKELQSKHNWKIFVHPVAPVLDITRDVVIKFNLCLKSVLDKLGCEQIVYMSDITEAILTDDCSALKPQYGFDDTHLNPQYVTLIQKSLNHS